MKSIRIALAQINPTVGDLAGNAGLIKSYIAKARSLGADIVALPELAITGYPPEDLLLKPHFVEENRRALDEITTASAGIVGIVGFVDSDGSDIYNAAAVISGGKLLDVYHKTFLPNYGVFDEERYFQSGRRCPVLTLGEARVGVNVCEDIWYEGGPTKAQALAGDAHLIINISASPYDMNKVSDRERMLCTRAEDNAVALAYCNVVGGQDELVFDGNSLIIDEGGHIIARGKAFEDDLIVADIDIEKVFSERLHDPRRRREKLRFIADESLQVFDLNYEDQNGSRPPPQKPPIPQREQTRSDETAETYAALVTGTRDYVRKNGFDKLYLGL